MRLLYVGLTPIQNPRPFQLMQIQPSVDLTVLYLLPSPENFTGEEYSNKSAFDHIVPQNYNYIVAKPWGRQDRSGFLTGLSWDAWRHASRNDVVVVYGHYLLAYWMAIIAARCFRRRLVLVTDATYLAGSASSGGWKLKLKPFIFRFLYNFLADAVCVPSTASRLYHEKLGVNPSQIVITPYVVNEPAIVAKSQTTDVVAFRSALGIPAGNLVFIFCAKFLQRKRPADAIAAFARIDRTKATLIMVGVGPLDDELHQLTRELDLSNDVIFTGLVNYAELPSYYTAADVLVFCSDHEPYGLPVNEMMLCGRPVIVSDMIGARLDLVEEGVTGWSYPAGDISALAGLMQKSVDEPASLQAMGAAARTKMKGWTSEVNVQRQLELFRKRGWLRPD